MWAYITRKIQLYGEKVSQALDEGDILLAVQSRAAQRELQEICRLFGDEYERQGLENLHIGEYYSTKEVSELLGVTGPTVTRAHDKLGGMKRNNAWLFPKELIDKEVTLRKKTMKRGKKKSMH